MTPAARPFARRKSWREKMAAGGGNPHIVILPKPYCGARAGGKLFIASPALVDDYLRAIPLGESCTVQAMRQDLAAAHGAHVTCPTSTGIFLRIVAEAALEDLDAGAHKDAVAPFWRMVEPDSPLAGKLSCGREALVALRSAEGL